MACSRVNFTLPFLSFEISNISHPVTQHHFQCSDPKRLVCKMTLLYLLQEKQRSSRRWTVDHSSDDIAVWRPSGGMHHLCPPPSLHHIDPALCDQPVCSEDRDCAVEGTGRQMQGVPGLQNIPLCTNIK